MDFSVVTSHADLLWFGILITLEDIEREVIRFAIEHYRGQMSEVARRLKIGRSTLYRKLETLQMHDETSIAPGNEPADAG